MEREAAPDLPRESILLSPEEAEPVHNLTTILPAEDGVEMRKQEGAGFSCPRGPTGSMIRKSQTPRTNSRSPLQGKHVNLEPDRVPSSLKNFPLHHLMWASPQP